MVVKLAGSVAAVTVATLLVWALEPFAPTVSLGVLYIFAVLPVAVAWGTVLVAAGRRREHARVQLLLPAADAHVHAAGLDELVCAGRVLRDGARRQRAGEQIAAAGGRCRAARARVLAARRDRGAPARRPAPGHRAGLGGDAGGGRARHPARRDRARPHVGAEGRDAPIPLEVDGRTVGTLYVPADADPDLGVRHRFLPALAALLAVAFDRSRLEQEALEAEALRRSDLVKTALLRAVSHDLRSPLTGITTAIGALRSETLVFNDDDRRVLLDTIAVDAERLGRLVGDLLDLSRLEAGGAEPEAEVWALDDLVREAVSDLPGNDRVDVAGEAPLVSVDPIQIQRVLANLLENALKFSPSSARVHVRITATRQEAIVRIVDQGPGLESNELERVFEPFYRRDGDQRSGAGLGLAIARGFAAANGGRVWAESRPGQGATFALALPVVEVTAELPA